jgi:ketosteroid isomerase-like protein
MPDPTQSARLETARAFISHIGRGDADHLVDLLSEHVTYRAPGDNALAGSFTGREAVAAHLAQLSERTTAFRPVQWEDWLVGELHVAALVTIHAQMSGTIYRGRQIILIGFDYENKIEALTVFFEDQGAIDRFVGR